MMGEPEPLLAAEPAEEAAAVDEDPDLKNGFGRHYSASGESTADEDVLQPKQLRKTKSVSFHSTTCIRNERKITSVQDCLQRMISGNTFIKVRNNLRQYHRFFSLTEDLTAVRWVPSKKSTKARVSVDGIKEIRVGKSTSVFRNRDFSEPYSEECAFSVIYGEEYATLDLVAPSPEEANIWVTGLNALIAPEGLDGKAAVRERWLEEMFARAAGDSLAMLDEKAAIELMRKLNSQIATVRIRQRLAECENVHRDDECRGKLTSREFIDLFKEIATRPDVYFLLLRHSNKEYMTVEDLLMFLEGEQGMSGLTWDKCMEIIKQFEPNPESRQNGQLMIDGLTRYLLSADCDVFSHRHRQVCQDMTQPMTHYFISCSHNTYLMQDQLRGPSSVEGYIRALSNGCRCIKVDCWDGKDGCPVVYHGNTLTTRVQFDEVVRVIDEYAFDASDYPLIIHLENHCSVAAQRLMAQTLQDVFGKRLYIHPANSPRRITEMSPHDLRHRIIIQGKKLSCSSTSLSGSGKDAAAGVDGEVSDDDEGGSMCPADCRRIELCRQLSDLVSLTRSTVHDSPTLKNNDGRSEVYSLSESMGARLSQTSTEDVVEINKQRLMRVFPNASRVDSSNFNPQDFWNIGCQMVALNFQTPGTMMDVYDGRFRQNGCCGFVLKPAVLRQQIAFYSPLSKDPVPGITPKLLRIKVISGQQFPKPRGSTAKATVVDPYVVLQVFGAPADSAELRGRTVSNEGNSPVFDETFEFIISLPEMALLRFLVLDDEFIGDDFIGQYTLPLECLQTGYRHVSLLSNTGEPLDKVTLFVHITLSSCLSGTMSRRKSKTDRMSSELKTIGLKDMDEFFKTSLMPLVTQTQRWCSDVAAAMSRLQNECGLGGTANIRQCMRVILHRLSNCPNVTGFCLKEETGGPPLLHVSHALGVSLSPHLQRSLVHLELVLAESQRMATGCDQLIRQLNERFAHVTETYAQLGERCQLAGLKGRKRERAHENFAWNARVVQGQMDVLETCRLDAKQRIQQMKASQDMVVKYSQKDRSPTTRERPRITVPPLVVPSAPCLELPACRTPAIFPPSHADSLPKSILKKSYSTADCLPGSTAVRQAAVSTSLPSGDGEAKHPVVSLPSSDGETKQPVFSVPSSDGEAEQPVFSVPSSDGEAKHPVVSLPSSDGEAKHPVVSLPSSDGEAKHPDDRTSADCSTNL